MRVSRRVALRGAAAAGAGLLLATPVRPAAAQPVAEQVEPGAGAWRTWVLSSGSQFAPLPPPDRATLDAELAEVQGLAAGRDAATHAQALFWDAGAPNYRWTEEASAVHLRRGAGSPVLHLPQRGNP
jgi:hypothetical protein